MSVCLGNGVDRRGLTDQYALEFTVFARCRIIEKSPTMATV
jgi:hypothetical protein